METYQLNQVVSFNKTREPYGEFSNMCGGFRILLDGESFRTSEALYQACRFPDFPKIQRAIQAEPSPMGAKMRSKPFRPLELGFNRPDFDDLRLQIMDWCLHLKLAQHYNRFGEVLQRSGAYPIVELSHNDKYWGAVGTPKKEPTEYIGHNYLGKLLVKLRTEMNEKPKEELLIVPKPNIPNFKLFGKEVQDYAPLH
jgi:ribA/ribD-fused uncharacterized protein